MLADRLKENGQGDTNIWTGCKKDPTFIVVNRTGTNRTNIPYRHSAFAHELFHSVQHNYDTQGCVETSYKWLMESTATSFEDELYPAVNREHSFAPFYVNTTMQSIDAKDVAERNYGAYVFFFYLTRIRKPPATDAVRFVWEATESADALHALDAGLKKAGAPLEKSWPDFAVYNWNVDAPYNLYKTIPSDAKLEDLTDEADIEETIKISVPNGDEKDELGTHQFSGNGQVLAPHLSMQYYQFDFPDATASSVVFYNGFQRALNTKAVTWIANFGNILTATPVSDPA